MKWKKLSRLIVPSAADLLPLYEEKGRLIGN
jgi:hypothetical protein